MKRVKPVRSAAVIVRVYPEERDSLRFNAGARHEHVGHIRQTRLGVRLRKGDKPSRCLVRRDYGERHSPAPSVARRSRHDPRAHRLHKAAKEIQIPGDKVSEKKEEGIIDVFGRVAFAGLGEEQRPRF